MQQTVEIQPPGTFYWHCDDHPGDRWPIYLTPTRERIESERFLKKRLGNDKLVKQFLSNLSKLKDRPSPLTLDGSREDPEKIENYCPTTGCKELVNDTSDFSYMVCKKHYDVLNRKLRSSFGGIGLAIPDELMKK